MGIRGKEKKKRRRDNNNPTTNKQIYITYKLCQIDLFPGYTRIAGLSHANPRTSDQGAGT
jgi:hypothetical protein